MQPDLQKRLDAINELNETKGREEAALAAIPLFRTDAENLADWEAVAEGYWQEHLAHQHIVMNGDDKDGAHVAAMLTTAKKAVEIVESHNLENLRGHAHRFLGRAFTYEGRHQEALNEYKQAQTIFSETDDNRILEINGFIAESLIRTGSIEEGKELAYNTYEDFDLPQYSEFKKNSYYAWAVWRTGIFPRLVKAFLELNIDFDRAKVRDIVEKSRSLLTGPYDFGYRLKEIEDALAKL